MFGWNTRLFHPLIFSGILMYAAKMEAERVSRNVTLWTLLTFMLGAFLTYMINRYDPILIYPSCSITVSCIHWSQIYIQNINLPPIPPPQLLPLTSLLGIWTPRHISWRIHPLFPVRSHRSKPSRHHPLWHQGFSQPRYSGHL